MPTRSVAEKAKALKKYSKSLLDRRKVFRAQLTEDRRSDLPIADFEIEAHLGSGGFAKVYLGRKNDEMYAIKVMQRNRIPDHVIEYVVRERQFLTAMDSEFVCRIRGQYRDCRNVYMYLEFATYGDLRAYMKRCADEKLTEGEAVILVSHIVCALEYIHACNVLYRDMKPGNCLIFEGGRVKMVDFGLSIEAQPEEDTFVGAHQYCAPEMYDGDHYTDAVDWWALGVLLYEILMGNRPFDKRGDTLKDVEEKVKGPIPDEFAKSALSADAKDLIKKLLDKNPATRIGIRKAGVEEVKDHPWFKCIDFADLLIGEVPASQLNLVPYEGTFANPTMFKGIGDETVEQRLKWSAF